MEEKKGLDAFLSEITKVEQLALLIFPLTIFLKANYKNDIDKYVLNQVSNLINESGSPEQIKGTEFLTELASIQAFEAIMYRDLNYVLN